MDFYYLELSPPCRAVMLTAKALGIHLNKKAVNLLEGEHMKPEFLAINPLHTIPTLVDGNLNLWESRAIQAYLVNKYGKDDSLYPKDPCKRALVDKALYFDATTLFTRHATYAGPVIFRGQKPDPEKLEKASEAVGYLNDHFLKGRNFVAGNNITIADHSIIATVTTMATVGVDLSRYPNVSAWLERCSAQMKGYDTENKKGANAFAEFVKGKF